MSIGAVPGTGHGPAVGSAKSYAQNVRGPANRSDPGHGRPERDR